MEGKIEQYNTIKEQEAQEKEKSKEAMIGALKKGNIDSALEIKEKFNIPEEVIQSPEIQEAVKEGMIYRLKKGYLDLVLEIKEKFNISEEVIQSPEIQEVAKEWMIDRLEINYLDSALEIKEKFNIPEEIVQEAAKEMMINKLKRVYSPYIPREDYIDSALKIKEKFNISEEVIQSPEVQKAAKEMMINKLETNHLDSALEIKEKFNIPEEIVQEAAKEGMNDRLREGYIDSALEIKEKFNIPEEIVQEAAKKRMISKLKGDYYRPGEDYIGSALKIKEGFNIPEEVIQSPEVQEAAKERMINKLKGDYSPGEDYIGSALKIKEGFNIPEEVIQSPEIQTAAKERLIYGLREGYINLALRIKEGFNIPEEVIQSPEIQTAAKEGMIYKIKNDYIDDAFEIKEKFNISEEIVQEAAKEVIFYRLRKGYIDSALKIKEKINIPEEVIQSPEIQTAAKERLIYGLREGYIDSALEIKEGFNIPEEVIQSPEVQEAAKEGMIYRLREGYIYDALEIKEKFNISEDVILSAPIQNIIRLTRIFNYDYDNDSNLASLETSKTDINSLTDDDLKELFKKAKTELIQWQEKQTIAEPFQAGAEVFGYKKMLEYIRRPYLSLHDAVHAFHNILGLYEKSSLSESEFYGQVLYQVKMDDREYSEGTAHHHLNAIAQTVNKDVAKIIEKAQKYKEIEKLQKLATAFNTPEAVFASWTNLKRYSELEQLLGKTGILDELKKLKTEGKDALYKYIETLAFHPDSKVNMNAVLEFWRDPESFLAAEASHTPYEVHDRKKPSNYLNMPNLDLTAFELRDALVEGKMDGLSAFTPFEIKYTIPLGDVKLEPLPDLISKALGSNKKGIKGIAKNSPKLFSELGKLLKPHGMNIVEYIQGKSLPDGTNLSQEIEKLLYNSDFGIERPAIKTREFIARISQKSDPEGAIAGDDTVNCMPFGDGKNTVYTFNPNTAQFVIRFVKSDGNERTIAQSVLTKDMDVQVPVPNVISQLNKEGEHLENILPADILTAAPVYAACDNVEVSPNYSDERHQKIIEAIFRDFFKEYMKRYAGIERLNPKKVPIGQGYTDALSQLPIEKNTFVPQAPVSYSDKRGENVYMLDLESNTGADLILQKQIQEIKTEKPEEPILPKIKGLEYLTFEDALKVAYLEGKAYSDNQSLMQFLFNMENALIAKDINNAAKDRPNMSLKYIDENEKMRGYMLAWEGRFSDENIKHDAEDFFNQPCVYIIDIATDRKNHMAGGSLIRGFVELYKQNYLDKGNLMPIFAQAREATSYQIVKKQLDKIAKDINVDFELIELPTYEVGKDTMHPIIIRPVSKNK